MVCTRPEREPSSRNDNLEIPDQLKIYLRRRERCVFEVREHLKKISHTSNIDDLIEELQETGLVDDSRFCENRIRYRVKNSRWGDDKIRFELKKLRIANELIEKYITTVPLEEWLPSLEKVLRKTGFSDSGGFDEIVEVRKKLSGKGFSDALSYKLLKEFK